uniref:BTB domain-containing protein n=1 Tax=Mycena chlorophos TaxID=658473 RepID=A0ABQ0LFB4_MYCCL|nr:predicted protein [Mycena chlorophos]
MLSTTPMTVAVDKPVFAFSDADFEVRSSDGSAFKVNREKLKDGSSVFRDMFASCDATGPQTVDLCETEAELTILFRLLHTPPDPPLAYVLQPRQEKVKTHLPLRYDSAIPLPVLRLIFVRLADKYAVEKSVLQHLDLHLIAHAPDHALEVYSLACRFEMPRVVNEASQYVLPLSRYSSEEIRLFPTVASYHDIHRLQAYRVDALQNILSHEDLFPHGYGTCPTHEDAAAIWSRTALILAAKIESNSDVGQEMASLAFLYQSCAICSKALRAALDMLAYKCRRVPRRLDQLPQSE